MIAASCLCGDVAWGFHAPLEFMSHCHCSMCRKAHGAAFATYAAVPEDRFQWVRGRERVRRYESSPGFFRPFCGRCGSVVAEGSVEGSVFMPVGCVDGDSGSRPESHIFVASKAPWHEIADDLPRFDANPPGYDTPEVTPHPPFEAGAGRVPGSCLCGGVAYEIEGEIDAIRNCHCSRCRKARSAAYASNGFVAIERFRWARGEELLESYKVPDAKRFTQVFCGVCGSSLPRVNIEAGFVVVPAGTLDGDPGGRERQHIFVESKAPWYEIADDLPQYAEYPPPAA